MCVLCAAVRCYIYACSVFGRLACVWQGLYKQALQYQTVLRSQTDLQGGIREQKKLLATLCLIQGELQRAGVSLAEDSGLHCPDGKSDWLGSDNTLDNCLEILPVQ